MPSDLEHRVDETLPAVKQEDLSSDLLYVIEKASPLEVEIAQCVGWYAATALFLNFGLCTIDKRQDNCISAHLSFPSIGELIGCSAWYLTEIGIVVTAAILSPSVALGTYFGMKALTNFLGYRYYKKQREKHEEYAALQRCTNLLQ